MASTPLSHVVLLTGGTGGLGRATARSCAEAGCRVVVADLSGEAAEATARELPGSGHLGLAMDVVDEGSVRHAFDQAEGELGPVGVLGTFAGFLRSSGSGTLEDTSVDEWDRVFSVNALGTFLCVREMLRRRRKRPVEGGRMVLVSSSAGQFGGSRGAGAYAASKAAVLGLTKTAAREAAPLGMTVNAIAPGPIETAMFHASLAPGTDVATAARAVGVVLDRVGRPEEIAGAFMFLISPEGGFTTGATIDVNGGLYMR